ncbi:MAG: 1-(5-phosphoribosyl)-5-[(5-phosphoribosylamino)methylideneamino]imidazole-4-carboxamide isomerase [Chloroflexi bacterium]|nr:1-(5-phosphoribosyl)-5-[(5-phosphoribosylamino)methylideneamino]imidazole-4-carboxamide isomerase [Chloroflexota bacterium]
MNIYPAIDMRGGKVVRLRQGDPNAQTVYADDPAQQAQQWAAQGARWLHVVNLDGAFTGSGHAASESPNLAALRRILAAVTVPVQFGGGLRDLDGIEAALGMGVARVVLGTVAVQQPEIVREAVARWGAACIVAGLDAKDGMIATHGWQTTSALTASEVARRMGAMGVERIVFTDIARDGMLQGVNVAATRDLARASGVAIIASGGVASLDDITQLRAHAADGIEGVIIGQALYTGAVKLVDALSAAA